MCNAVLENQLTLEDTLNLCCIVCSYDCQDKDLDDAEEAGKVSNAAIENQLAFKDSLILCFIILGYI